MPTRRRVGPACVGMGVPAPPRSLRPRQNTPSRPEQYPQLNGGGRPRAGPGMVARQGIWSPAMKFTPMPAGTRFGRLVIVRYIGPNGLYECQCDCGESKKAYASNLRLGKTKSCGCYRREQSFRLGKARKRHGLTGSVTYRSWNSMLQRTTNPKHVKWRLYGGRGITVCDRWLEFENFLADMGLRPSGTSLDRRNPDGNYEPSNCRWATDLEQRHNRSRER